MAIEGSLKELAIQDVLQLLDLSRKTGALTVRSERLDDDAVVQFEAGAIVFAMRRRAWGRLGQVLLRAGKVTEREVARALEIQRSDPTRRLGEILLEMGSLSEADLERQLRFQIEETIYDLMAWTHGRFRFEQRAITAGRVGVRIRVDSLLMEGARRIDEWARLEPRIRGVESVPVLVKAEDDATPLDLRPDEWEVLAEIDGRRDLRQLATDLGRATFDVAKIVYGLVSTGVVDVADRRPAIPERDVAEAVAAVEALLEGGDVESAARRSADLDATHADRPELAVLSGRILAAQGRHRAATEAFARAAVVDPLSAEAHLRLGFAAVRIGEFERALGAWTTFLRLAPEDGRAETVRRALAGVRELNHLLQEELTPSTQ